MLQTAIVSAADKTLQDTSDYFLVLGDNYNWVFVDKNPWFLSITDYCGHVVMQSVNHSPQLGVKMFGYEHGSKEELRYGVTGSLEELLELRYRYLSNKNLAYAVLEGIKGAKEWQLDTAEVSRDLSAGNIPIEILVKAYSASEEVFIKQADSKVAQSQAAINSAKITRLEKELKQARELQKLLKKLR